MKFLITLCSTILFTLNVYAANPKVEIQTNMGSMTIELYPDQAPITVKNFLGYVKSGFYNDTVFHRIINNFMIQGGGYKFNKAGSPELKKTKPAIKNEGKKNKLKNDRGTIAMARTGNPHSATSQFFINHKNNKFLNSSDSKWGYAVFGKLVKGEKTLDKIATTTTKADDFPVKKIIIKSIKKL